MKNLNPSRSVIFTLSAQREYCIDCYQSHKPKKLQ